MSARAEIVPARISEVRQLLQLTQGELAEHLGCHRNSVANWEAGTAQPHPSSLLRLVQLAGRPIGWFYEKEVIV